MINIIEKLSKLNDKQIFSINDEEFKTYGRIIDNIDTYELVEIADRVTSIPDSGNVYVTSQPELEEAEIFNTVRNEIYGEIDIQFGYCNGRNSTYNGFEYHKGSEVLVAVTDLVLVLGHTWDLKDNTYHTDMPEIFYIPKNSIIELYQTTLHLSPSKVCDEGFKAVIILPRGTNTPLENKNKSCSTEGEILLMRNKWIITHKDREPLVKNGAYIGLLGENKEVKY